MRPIDADPLFDQIRLQANRSSLGETRTPEISGLEVISLIKAAPTIDAEPVRHGRWIREDAFSSMIDVPWLCSECNQKLLLSGLLTPYGYGYRYCPNCGAKMDGGAEDADGV